MKAKKKMKKMKAKNKMKKKRLKTEEKEEQNVLDKNKKGRKQWWKRKQGKTI